MNTKYKHRVDDSFVSVIIILNSYTAQFIPRIIDIQKYLELWYSDYEILLLAQKSIEEIKQTEVSALLRDVPCIRYLQLSANLDEDDIWFAGAENAIGDFTIFFGLGRDPIPLINESVTLCKSGHDVVVGVACEKASIPYRIFRPFTGWLLRLVRYNLSKNATSFRCLSRRALNAVIDTGLRHQQFFMRIQKTGYESEALHYKVVAASRKKTMCSALHDVFRLVVFNSVQPLRGISWLGVAGSILGCLFSLYSILINFFKNDVVEGWTSMIFLMSFFSAIQFIILAFIAEYINRILVESSRAATYSIIYERTSRVMLNLDRINVLEGSCAESANLVQTGRDR